MDKLKVTMITIIIAIAKNYDNWADGLGDNDNNLKDMNNFSDIFWQCRLWWAASSSVMTMSTKWERACCGRVFAEFLSRESNRRSSSIPGSRTGETGVRLCCSATNGKHTHCVLHVHRHRHRQGHHWISQVPQLPWSKWVGEPDNHQIYS